MNTDKLIIDIFLYIFEAFVFLYYAGLISEPRKKSAVRIFSTLAGYTALFFVYEFNNLIATGLSIVLICTLLFGYLYTMSLKSSLFHSFILFGVMAASEVVVMGIVTLIADGGFDVENINPSAYLIDVTISKLAYFIILVVIARLFGIKESQVQKKKSYWIILIMPLSSIIMMTIFRNISINFDFSIKNYIIWIISSLLVLFSNIIVFIIFETSQKDAMELSALKTIQQQAKYDNEYMQVLEHQNNEINMLLHDTKNHYLAISNMNSADEMKEYIANVLDDVQQYNIVHLTNNKMLDLLLSKYSVLCQNNGVKLNVEVKTANLLYVPEADLSTIINNLMDNALESAKVSTEKEIDFSIRHINGFDTLTVSNSCNEEPMQKSGKLITTKTAKSVHGFGTKIIKKYATKNNATYEWFYDSEKRKFNSTIIFQSNN